MKHVIHSLKCSCFLSLLLNFVCLTSFAQDDKINVKGLVTDAETNEGLPGVSITVEGTTTGTITNGTGEYELSVSPNATLVFSYIGFLSEKIPVNGRSKIDLTLAPDIMSLQEVVVVGYGTTTKRDLTGAISVVKSDQITQIPVPSVNRALQGRVAGVQILANSGSPGSSTAVRIRGMGSINGNNDPLYVVDGIPLTGAVEHLVNPNDVESIEVLKDASAAAIYGSRGANGVVLITTKKGKSGAPKVSVDSYYGMSNETRKPQLAGPEEFVRIYQTANKNGNTEDQMIAELKDVDPASFTGGTNWWEELTRTGAIQNYNVSISGGGDKFTYLTSAGYFNEEGYVKKTDYERLSFRFNAESTLSSFLKIGTNVGLTNNKRNGIRENTAERVGYISNVYQGDPISPIYKTEEEVIADGGDPANPLDFYHPQLYTNRQNIVGKLARQFNDNTEFRLLGDVFAEVKIVNGLTFRSELGLNIRRREGSNFSPRYYIDNLDENDDPSINVSSASNNNWVWNNIANYQNTFGKHKLTVMGGVTAEKLVSNSLSVEGRGIPSNEEELRYISAATILSGASGAKDFRSIVSYLGRINYNYDNKYLFTGSIRYDGTSIFSPGNKWGSFPSFSLGWVASEEKFLKQISQEWLSMFKLRVSWGRLGNQNIPTNSIYTLLEGGLEDRYPFGTDNVLAQGYRPGNIGTSNLVWETIEQMNIGGDFDFFEKISLTADYFVRNTVDMLLRVPLPNYFGYRNPWANAGELQNRGFEFDLRYRGEAGKLKYNIGGNMSFIRNEVISLADADAISSGNTRAGNATITQVGEPISMFKGYVTDGIFQTEEEVTNHANVDGDLLQPNAQPGDFRFKDVNGDGLLNDEDQKVIGSPHPDFFYGFNIDLTYKNFVLNTFFQGQQGNEIFMYEKYYTWTGDGSTNSRAGLYDLAWKGPGTSNSQPILTTNTSNNNFRVSDWYLSDGSFMRLKNIQLGYNLPASVARNLRLSNALIYISGTNLFTITKFDGLDPELGVYDDNGNENLNMGINQYAYPVPKVYTLGLQVNF